MFQANLNKKSFVDVLSLEKQIKFGDRNIKVSPSNLGKLRETSIKLEV